MREKLSIIFTKLNELIAAENMERRANGTVSISPARIEVLGQTSLLIQPELTWGLSLIQTGDVDAFINADYFVKKNLTKILPEYGFIYDEDSPYIFIPEGSHFLPFLKLSFLEVVVIDPESALVSKAVKAPEKNLHLIRQAIASGDFPHLVERIIKAGIDLNKFK